MQRHASQSHCPCAVTLSLIGGKYKPIILWSLHQSQAVRFGEIHRAIPQATTKMLTQQLRELEADALISRQIYPVVPPKVEYSLTELGKSMVPILEALNQWGVSYVQKRETGS